MGMIEYSLPIEVVQIKFSTPNTNLINPNTITLGRNESFTEIDRVYIKCDTSRIPSVAIIKSAILSVPILATQDDDRENDAHIMGYAVTSELTNIDYITWNNLSKIKLGKVIFSADVHKNSLVEIDLKENIKSFIAGTVKNNGFLFINNESQHNQLIFDSQLVNRSGLSLLVRYYDPNESVYEKRLNIDTSSTIHYTESILASYLDNISVFVKNIGSNQIKASLEVSSNNIDFIEESSVEEIGYNESKILVPYYSGKFVRVKLITDNGTFIKSNIDLQAKLI